MGYVDRGRLTGICNSETPEAFSNPKVKSFELLHRKDFKIILSFLPFFNDSQTSEAVAEMAALSSDTSVREKEPTVGLSTISSQISTKLGEAAHEKRTKTPTTFLSR